MFVRSCSQIGLGIKRTIELVRRWKLHHALYLWMRPVGAFSLCASFSSASVELIRGGHPLPSGVCVICMCSQEAVGPQVHFFCGSSGRTAVVARHAPGVTRDSSMPRRLLRASCLDSFYPCCVTSRKSCSGDARSSTLARFLSGFLG